MSDNIVNFTGLYYGELNPQEILKQLSTEEDIESVLIIAVRKETTTYHSNFADGKYGLWLVQNFIYKLMKGDFRKTCLWFGSSNQSPYLISNHFVIFKQPANHRCFLTIKFISGLCLFLFCINNQIRRNPSMCRFARC